MRWQRHSDWVYQAVGPQAAGPAARVTVVIEVPADSAALVQRTAELADEFGTMMTRLLPGVHARTAVISAVGRLPAPADSMTPPRQGLLVDIPHRRVTVDGTPVRLTYREFELLRYLASASGATASRAELMNNVWADLRAAPTSADRAVSDRTVDTHVQRLRAKLGDHGRALVTVRGRGYRFDPGDDVRITFARKDLRLRQSGM